MSDQIKSSAEADHSLNIEWELAVPVTPNQVGVLEAEVEDLIGCGDFPQGTRIFATQEERGKIRSVTLQVRSEDDLKQLTDILKMQ